MKNSPQKESIVSAGTLRLAHYLPEPDASWKPSDHRQPDKIKNSCCDLDRFSCPNLVEAIHRHSIEIDHFVQKARRRMDVLVELLPNASGGPVRKVPFLAIRQNFMQDRFENTSPMQSTFFFLRFQPRGFFVDRPTW